MSFKYAAFTVMMPEYTLAETVALLGALGYDGVEWRVHTIPNAFPENADYWRSNRATVDVTTLLDKAHDVRKLTEDHGLYIIGLGTYLSYKLLDDVERCMEAARIMGCGSVRVQPPGYDGSENYNDLYEEAVDGYAKVEDIARSYRVRANIELHHGRICSSASLAYRLVSNFDPDFIGVILDPGNMVCEGYENWQLGLELLGPYLSHVHVKNAAWIEDEATSDGVKRWKTAQVPMREGIVPWDDVLMVLNNVGYNGWLSFEDFSAGETRAKLAGDIAYLKQVESMLSI